MSKLRVAVLEDDATLLDHILRCLKAMDTVIVVTAQEDVEKFKERVRANTPDALLLDIEIHGDKQAGLDIAREFELPVLFISGRIRDELLAIEKIQRLREQVPVEHLSKGFDDVEFRQTVNRFLRLVDATSEPTMIGLRLQNKERLQVRLKDIVSIESPENEREADNNNRIVYFSDRLPVIVPKLSMTDAALEENGFPKGSMLRISKFSCVNPERIMRWSRTAVWVECVLDGGKRSPRMLEVGASYVAVVDARLKGTN
jgi:CheY-like chemotaxis protein